PAAAASAGVEAQPVLEEVEVDLERAQPGRQGAGGDAARRHEQRDVPRVVEPRPAHQAHLADDLCPQVQRRQRVAPGLERQGRPGRLAFGGGEAHGSTCTRRPEAEATAWYTRWVAFWK